MPTTPSILSNAEGPARKWQLVERIVATGSFAMAPQLRKFLLFVARRALIGGRQDVTESEIARMSLGRGSDFDPKEDDIVRVQAHQVRARLKHYFKNEGLQEPVILAIPKRNYLPLLVPRQGEATPEAKTESPAMVSRAQLYLQSSFGSWQWHRVGGLRLVPHRIAIRKFRHMCTLARAFEFVWLSTRCLPGAAFAQDSPSRLSGIVGDVREGSAASADVTSRNVDAGTCVKHAQVPAGVLVVRAIAQGVNRTLC